MTKDEFEKIIVGLPVKIKRGGTSKGYLGRIVDYEPTFPFQTVSVEHPVTGVVKSYNYENVELV